jgi:predicted nucleotidyltransferase
MKLEEVKKTLKNHKESLFTRYSIRHLAIFGSVSRGEETAVSDLDILVEFNKPIGIKSMSKIIFSANMKRIF